jgi:hypothetical protein
MEPRPQLGDGSSAALRVGAVVAGGTLLAVLGPALGLSPWLVALAAGGGLTGLTVDSARRRLGEIVATMRHPRALNALMAALLYYPASKVNLSSAEKVLPEWLLQELTTLRSRASLQG